MASGPTFSGPGSAPCYSSPVEQLPVQDRPDGPRYEEVGTLGRGSMGVVALGWDRWLHRQVAIKIPHHDPGVSTEPMLRREAQLAARLDHPAIAAIYDISQDGEGRPFFVMRLVRGEPLYRLVQAGDHAAAIRAVRQVTEAMGHAHQQRVAHRDLSPSNVMVGELGLASVIDWGFAAEFGDLDAPRRVGTPGYAAPEQRRGAPPDPRADVWSLGALLRYAAGPSTPPELGAIIERATVANPSARYADAREMARDLLAWEDGRLVSAHAYTTAELIGRRLWPWRYPLGIALIALIALLGQGWWDSWTVRQQRDRAIEADRRAVAALADALAEQAVSAWTAGDSLRAADLARRSLEHGPQPNAMGILLAELPAPVHARSEHPLTADCDEWSLTSDGSVAWCRQPSGATILPWQGEPWRLSTLESVEDLRVSGSQIAVLLVDGTLQVFDQLAHEPVHVDSRPGTFLHDRQIWRGARHGPGLVDEELPASPCEEPDPVLAASQDRRGAWWISCVGGALWRLPSSEPAELRRASGSDPVLRIASTRSATWAVTGRGVVVRLDGPAQEVSLGEVARQLLAVPDADLLLVRGSVGRARLLDAASGRWISDLSDHSGTSVDREGVLAWIAEGKWVRARLMDPRFVPSWRVPHGLSSVAISPDGRRVVTGDGGGFVRTFGLDGVQLPEAERWQYRVIKSVSFGADGTLAAVAVSDEPLRVWGPSGESVPVEQGIERGLRRVAVWSDGSVLALRYGEGILPVLPLSPTFSYPGIDFRDVAVDRDRDVAYLTSDRGSYLYEPSGDLHQLDPAPSHYIAGGGGRFVYTYGQRVSVRGVEQPRDIELPVVATAVALAGDLLIVGGRDGGLRVYAPGGELLAVLPAHEDRLAGIAVHPDGRRIVTVGWDGRVRLLTLEPLLERATPGSASPG